MKVEYLETVLKVAECGSFKQAALLSHCSQSAVSKQVKTVEEELGAELFKRSSSSNRIELTEACTKALPFMKQIIENHDLLFLTVSPKQKKAKKFSFV